MKKFFILLLCFVAISVNSAQAKYKEEGWNDYKSRFFIIYYKNTPIDFVRKVNKTAEDYYQDIRRNLGFYGAEMWTSENRTKIYIYEDQENFVKANQEHPWAGGVASFRERVIRTFPADHGFFDSLLPHELGHIIFHDYVGYDADVPMWLEEGIAIYQEDARRWGANKYVKKLIENNKFIPLTELDKRRLSRNSAPEDVDIFYAESASIAYFLINEYGDFHFLKLCKELKSGKHFINALKEAYGTLDSLERLNTKWVFFLKKQ